MKKLALLALLALTACAGSERPARVVYQTVKVPVPVSCVPRTLSPAPAGLQTPQSLAAIPDGPERYVRLAADWFARVARMTETEAVVAGCQRAAPPP